MSEAKYAEEVNTGSHAERIYEDEFVQKALDVIEAEIIDAIKGSLAEESEVRERAYIMYRLLQNFRQQFKSAIRNGEAAQKELLRIRDPGKFRQLFGR